MSSSASEKKTLEIRLTRKVVRDFVEHAVLPDLNGLMQPNDNGKANHKSVHDSDISDSNGMQPVILLDRLSADEMKKHSVHRRLPMAAKTTSAIPAPAPATADNASTEPLSKMPRQQKTPTKVSNAKGDVPSAPRSTRSKAPPMPIESTRSLRNKNV